MGKLAKGQIANALDSLTGVLGIADQIKMGDDTSALTLTEAFNQISAVTTERIQNSAVTTNKIADGSVISKKLADNAVTEDTIADNAVSTNKIEDEAVTEGKLSQEVQAKLNSGGTAYTGKSGVTVSGTVISLANNGVTSGKVANNAITMDKLNTDVKNDLVYDLTATSLTLPRIESYDETTGEYEADLGGGYSTSAITTIIGSCLNLSVSSGIAVKLKVKPQPNQTGYTFGVFERTGSSAGKLTFVFDGIKHTAAGDSSSLDSWTAYADFHLTNGDGINVCSDNTAADGRLIISTDLSNYYTKSEVDTTTDSLDQRILVLEENPTMGMSIIPNRVFSHEVSSVKLNATLSTKSGVNGTKCNFYSGTTITGSGISEVVSAVTAYTTSVNSAVTTTDNVRTKQWSSKITYNIGESKGRTLTKTATLTIVDKIYYAVLPSGSTHTALCNDANVYRGASGTEVPATYSGATQHYTGEASADTRFFIAIPKSMNSSQISSFQMNGTPVVMEAQEIAFGDGYWMYKTDVFNKAGDIDIIIL